MALQKSDREKQLFKIEESIADGKETNSAFHQVEQSAMYSVPA